MLKIILTCLILMTTNLYAVEKINAIIPKNDGPYEDYNIYALGNLQVFMHRTEKKIYFPENSYTIDGLRFINLSRMDQVKTSETFDESHSIMTDSKLVLVSYDEKSGHYKYKLHIVPIKLIVNERSIANDHTFKPIKAVASFKSNNEVILEGTAIIHGGQLILTPIRKPQDEGFELIVMRKKEVYLKQTKDVSITITIND